MYPILFSDTSQPPATSEVNVVKHVSTSTMVQDISRDPVPEMTRREAQRISCDLNREIEQAYGVPKPFDHAGYQKELREWYLEGM